MTWQAFFPYLIVMAVVTYLIRMLPLTLFRKPIRSVFIRSFLHYVPYAVLAAMTIPDVLYATGYTGKGSMNGLWAALGGLVVACVLAWRGKGLLTVAVAACAGVAAVQGLLLLF